MSVRCSTESIESRVINAKGEGLLTAREDQVMNLVAEGLGNREIALQLGITENTVKKSLLRIYDKLGVSNRVELVLYALTHRGAGERPTCPPSVLQFRCRSPWIALAQTESISLIPVAGLSPNNAWSTTTWTLERRRRQRFSYRSMRTNN